MTVFNKIITTTALVFSIFTFAGLSSISASAVAFDGNIKVATDLWVGTDTGVQNVGTSDFENYNCISGPNTFRGINMALIKRDCASAVAAFGNNGKFAYISFFDARYGRDQVYYGFYAPDGQYKTANGQVAGWQPYEPNFNAVFVTTGTFVCDVNSCSNFQPLINGWQRVECTGAPISNFTAQETQAICSRSVNQNQHFAYKATTSGRIPNEVSFVGTWSGNAWIDPVTGAPAAFK
jgi:hypothetical protein